jgi:hypothetical protein
MALVLVRSRLAGALMGSLVYIASLSAAAASLPVGAGAALAAAESSDDAPRVTAPELLGRYRFHDGFHAGSLRSEVPLPLFDRDPNHLWNRLFAAFWIRPLKPSGRDLQWAVGPPRPGADEGVPAELSDRLRNVWRQTYNRDPERRIEGGDVLEPPLFPHPNSLLSDRYFTAANAILDEFLHEHGERLIRVPLKRALLQRDLWPVFDLLQGDGFWDDANVRRRRGETASKKYSEAENERKGTLAHKIAAVMQAVALTKEEVASLPDTYDLAVRSGQFTPELGDGRARPYLPAHLMDGSGDWIEVNTYGEGKQFHGLPSHTGGLGFEGRAWFRVFYRFPAVVGGRQALERFLADPEVYRRDAEGWLMGPDVPPGTQVALARMLLTIDRNGEIHPTRILEDLQLRVLQFVDGGKHLETDSGFGQDVFQYEMRRAALFDGPVGGGLIRVPNGAPRYFLAMIPFSTFATSYRFTPESAGGLMPLRMTCTICHEHANEPVRTTQNTLRPFPEGFPFGKASLRSVHVARTPMPPGGPSTLARRVIEWKVSQRSFRNLEAAMRQARR